MRYLIILVFLLLYSINSLKAQEGFIQAYDINEGGLAFYNMLLKEDTLILCGGVQSLDYPQWGLFFAKMDTLGNFLDYKVHYDTLGDTYAFGQNYDFIQTSDGGYALVGQLFARKHPIMMKLDANGELEFVREYPDTTVLSIRHWGVVEFDQGFISIGAKQQSNDGTTDVFIMRTDKQGQKIWEVSYGGVGLYDSFQGIQKISDNEFLITGASSNGSTSVSSLFDLWGISKVFKIDTLGDIIWEWTGEQAFAHESRSSPQKLFHDSDGSWIHEGVYITVFNDEENGFQGEIVKRDTNFNIIWSTRFGEPTSNRNNFTTLTPTPDGGWVAAGNYWVTLATHPVHGYPTQAYRPGWLAKVNTNGDSLWMRTDTLYYHENSSVIHKLSGVVALPSGSVIACGQLDRIEPEPSKSFGWVIKVDKDGCIEPGCNPIIDGVDLTPLIDDFNVFPNPTNHRLTISGTGAFDLELYGGQGRLLQSQEKVFETTSLDLSTYLSGIYFVKIKQGKGMIIKKIVKA